jgi:hypothetical protein
MFEYMNFKKIMFIFFVLSVALAWNRNHFVLCKFSQVILNMSEKHVIMIKSKKFESSRKPANGLFRNILYDFFVLYKEVFGNI